MRDFLWIFTRLALPLTALAALIALFNLAFAFLLLDSVEMEPAAHESGITRLIIANFRVFVVLHFTLAATGLTASIGLLKNRLWGLRLWWCLLAVGIAWCLAVVLAELLLPGAAADTEGPGRALRFSRLVTGVAAPMGVAVALFFAWLLKRLLSREVREALS